MELADASLSRWLEQRPERWALLNVILLTVLLVLLGPGSWLGRILGYSALIILVAWRVYAALTEARASGLGMAAAMTQGVTTFGYIAVCAATIVFGLEYAQGIEATLAFVLFAFQLYFFRLFSEPEQRTHP